MQNIAGKDIYGRGNSHMSVAPILTIVFTHLLVVLNAPLTHIHCPGVESIEIPTQRKDWCDDVFQWISNSDNSHKPH